MSEERTNAPEETAVASPEANPTRRKGGRGGNGSNRRQHDPPPGTVNVPEGLFLWLARAGADEIKILFWLAYCQKQQPEVPQRVEAIARATGLSDALALILLRQLVTARRVVQFQPEGFRLAELTPDQWMPDD